MVTAVQAEATELLTSRQTMFLLGISRPTLLNWTRDRRIPFQRDASARLRFPVSVPNLSYAEALTNPILRNRTIAELRVKAAAVGVTLNFTELEELAAAYLRGLYPEVDAMELEEPTAERELVTSGK